VSRHAVLALGSAHALAVAAVLTVGMPPGLAVAGAAALGVHALIQIRRHALSDRPEQVAAVEIRGPEQIRVIRRDGTHDDWEIAGAPVIAPTAVLLDLQRADAGRRSLWLFRDACPADGHRHLRVLLRWRALSEPHGEGAA
jgi:hypothetical protein